MDDERRMGLGELTDLLQPERVIGLPVGEVRGLAYDSRLVDPGDLFFAVPGAHADGHAFAAEAVDRGALAVVAERQLPGIGVPQLVVRRTRVALADAADRWFGQPSERLHVVGVTGTDGKTTTCFLAAGMLRGAGRRPGLAGTVAIGVGDRQEPNQDRNTTPEAPELQALLAEMVAAGNDSVVMEATSHGLAQDRVRNCRFDVAIVTNLTSEHLDFHGTLDAYREAKALLVGEAPIAILNADDPNFEFFRGRALGRVVSYGLGTDAQVRAREIEGRPDGTGFRVETADWSGSVRLQLPGSFNVHNALAVLALARVEGIDLDAATDAIGRVRGVPGRMERIDEGQPFTVIVDYAHTADALEKVLRELRPLATGRLIALFGSAGERDTTKRPAMGAVSARLADLTVIADEDPRLEDPQRINRAIADGARTEGAVEGETLLVIDDRAAAIHRAVEMAGPGDVLLLAGKGHEQSIIYGTQPHPWDEATQARRALHAAGYRRR